MRIGLFHGYELIGSGSNEYNRYLARSLLQQSHTVHIICREKSPQRLDFLGELWDWREDGQCDVRVLNADLRGKSVLHRIPCGPIYPVYLTDKQRPGNVKAFINLTDAELQTFKDINQRALDYILQQVELDVLLANHVVMQPSVALRACKHHGVPLIVFPHGSAIEYSVKKDPRYMQEARTALTQCDAIISGNREVRDRLIRLFPDLQQHLLHKTHIVGVGVDSALFTPVARAQRKQHLARYIESLPEPHTVVQQGKSPQLVQELYHQLAQGQWQSVTEYRERYINDALDSDCRAKLQRLDCDDPVLIFVGAFTAGKGIQSLLCALPLVMQTFPRTQLLLVGSGAYREVLEALLYALANQDRALLHYLAEKGFDLDNSEERGAWTDVLHFIRNEQNLTRLFTGSKDLLKQVMFLGRMDHAQLAGIFPCADLAVFPSVVPEAYPLVLMESLANGVLPLVSYFSGFMEGIDELEQYLPADIVTRLKLPMDAKQRIEQIAANIIALLEATRSRDMSDRLAQLARQHYDWSHRAKAMAQAMQEVCTRDDSSTG